MSDTNDINQEEAVKVTEQQKNLTQNRGMSSMQGKETTEQPQDIDLENFNRIKKSEFSPETSKKIKEQGIDDVSQVLPDNTGKSAEQITKIVAETQGLPDGNGGLKKYDQVIYGQYNDQGNGIDLVGISDGKPNIIEVKKRANPDRDGVGTDTVKNLNPETEALMQNILLERANNPVLAKKFETTDLQEPDTEMSPDQMSDLWTRDRWMSLVKNKRETLEQAGISSEYLDLDTLTSHPYSNVWKQILDNRQTVIVSGDKDNVSNKLLREATLKKGFNVSVVDLNN